MADKSKAAEMAARLRNRYNSSIPASSQKEVPVDIPNQMAGEPSPFSDSISSNVQRRRGRPKGSSTRTEAYRRVCFEARVSLIDGFEEAAARKGMTLHQAYESALQAFVRH